MYTYWCSCTQAYTHNPFTEMFWRYNLRKYFYMWNNPWSGHVFYNISLQLFNVILNVTQQMNSICTRLPSTQDWVPSDRSSPLQREDRTCCCFRYFHCSWDSSLGPRVVHQWDRSLQGWGQLTPTSHLPQSPQAGRQAGGWADRVMDWLHVIS